MIQLKSVAHYVTDKIKVSELKKNEYITTDNMLPNRNGIVECEELPKAISVTKYIPGDVLISNIRPYFKKIWYSTRTSGCSNDVIVFRTNDDTIDSKFLYYVLSDDAFFSYMMAGANGTKMPRGNKELIPDYLIPDFDIKKQNKIANILSNYDDLIKNSQKQIKLLEEAAQRYYKEWFVNFHFSGHENIKIVDGVPIGWEKRPVNKIIGKIPRTKQIKATEYLHKGSIPIIDQSKDFIAGYTNDMESLVNINAPVIVFGDHTRILKYIQFPFARGADGTQLIISNTINMPQSLLYLSLIAVDLSNYHYARHFKYLKAESILIPTQDIAKEFDVIVSPLLLQIQLLRNKCNKLSQARDLLLPKLMNGEIDI